MFKHRVNYGFESWWSDGSYAKLMTCWVIISNTIFNNQTGDSQIGGFQFKGIILVQAFFWLFAFYTLKVSHTGFRNQTFLT